MMKTAITVLQEMMIKSGEIPEYECIAQSGPQHLATFEYRCKSRGMTVTATARSKKEAKQEAAKRMLSELYVRGMTVPPPYACPPDPSGPENDRPEPMTTKALPSTGEAASTIDARSYVALLKELCEHYGAGAPVFDLVGDTGPPHCRQFTIAVRLGQHERRATATTKKAAKQHAAEQLYKYLRHHLSRISEDFVEEDALVRAHEKAMKRYVEQATPAPFRAPLSQKISHYHLGLLIHIDQDKLALGGEALASTHNGKDPVRYKYNKLSMEKAEPGYIHLTYNAHYARMAGELETVCAALGLSVASEEVGGLTVVHVTPSAPALTTAGLTSSDAHAAALRYLRLAIARRPSLEEDEPLLSY